MYPPPCKNRIVASTLFAPELTIHSPDSPAMLQVVTEVLPRLGRASAALSSISRSSEIESKMDTGLSGIDCGPNSSARMRSAAEDAIHYLSRRNIHAEGSILVR